MTAEFDQPIADQAKECGTPAAAVTPAKVFVTTGTQRKLPGIAGKPGVFGGRRSLGDAICVGKQTDLVRETTRVGEHMGVASGKFQTCRLLGDPVLAVDTAQNGFRVDLLGVIQLFDRMPTGRPGGAFVKPVHRIKPCMNEKHASTCR